MYYFEEQYINYLVAKGVLPRACSQVRVQGAMALEVMREGNDKEKAYQGFEFFLALVVKFEFRLWGRDGGVGGRRRRRGWLETATLREIGDAGAAGDWRRRRLGLDRAHGLVRPSSGPARPTRSGSTKGQRWSFWNVSLSRLLFFLF